MLAVNVEGLMLDPFTARLKRGETCDDVLRMLLDGMDPVIFPETGRPKFKCECGIDRVWRTLSLLPKTEVDDILEQNEQVEVTCEFCARRYQLSALQIGKYFAEAKAERAAAE